jgi:hypothetical protein
MTLVFGGEAILYNVRERRHLWSSLPGRWVIAASIAGIAIISGLAAGGLILHAKQGSHDALMLADGEYARLFELQAQAFLGRHTTAVSSSGASAGPA